ncbi:PREDICTED: SWI/SNF-related matrix-associated actin-dependent regulator of chromatin subfamily A-like protein 1 isoform X1 [Theobroma cacao]|uniref:SWI/SNF-related matrix-associated actin-dependent regulator of chromatin subfamily A-like protein 1 isoform X1 n=1 Tax=Theobroma cacao TaxID=3641 RepID=A0AB32WJA3_THECC|nr:PREDICTED: SWI/SNF-related matrix-associated actin-dependent regulator of chromatin subfamily A-like protein 1 isoform X1 [Theobroma cacao]
MELDEWELSAEEWDYLERDAFQKIAQQRNHSSYSSSSFNQNPITHSPSAKAGASSGTLPSSIAPKTKPADQCSKEQLPKLSVKFILHATGNIAAKFSYKQVLVDAFRKIPKAAWNAQERLWMLPLSSLSSAEKVLCEVSGFKVEVENLHPLVQRAIAAASALPDLRVWYDRIPSYIESKLLPFQRDGVRFVLQHGGRALLADEMGLGKTLQAIAVAACIRDSWPVLVLAPSSLRLHWASMIQQWLNIPPSDIVVIFSQVGGSNKGGFTILSSKCKDGIHLDGLFNIISYDLVPKLENVLMASEFKVVIADESHFLKNAQAKRTTTSLPIIKKAQYAMLLTGTPALSRPIELFKQLEALYPDVYRKIYEYGDRYCKGGIFGTYQGASNHEELHNLMKATVMIRRLKKDVLCQLPMKRRQQVFLELTEKDMKKISSLFQELNLVKGKIKARRSEEEVHSLKLIEKNLINKIYTDSAEAKIPAVLDYLETVIEAGCKFLIFAHHQPMIEAIHQFLLKKKVGCIRIDGATPASSRQALVNDFQEKDAIRAAVLSIKAGGVGLTLTAASTVIFAELSWTPGDLIQAEDRAHRIGQASSVNIYYLLANDTVDDIIWDVVQNKLETLGQMLDGHENTLEVSTSQQQRSPLKQKTLDSFTKRCNSIDDAGQMLDGHENTLEVSTSQQQRSPLKQKTLDSFTKRCNSIDDAGQMLDGHENTLEVSTSQQQRSPLKQKTLDSFMKRCNSIDDAEHQSKLKYPRH